MPICANCMAVEFEAAELPSVGGDDGDSVGGVVVGAGVFGVALDGEVATGASALSVTMPSVRASNLFSAPLGRICVDRRRADDTPGNVMIAFSVVHVISFSANADESAVTSSGIMY